MDRYEVTDHRKTRHLQLCPALCPERIPRRLAVRRDGRRLEGMGARGSAKDPQIVCPRLILLFIPFSRGCYTLNLYPGLRLISVNNPLGGDALNVWMLMNQTDPDGTVQWIIDQLVDAEKAGDKVGILKGKIIRNRRSI